LQQNGSGALSAAALEARAASARPRRRDLALLNGVTGTDAPQLERTKALAGEKLDDWVVQLPEHCLVVEKGTIYAITTDPECVEGRLQIGLGIPMSTITAGSARPTPS